MRTAFYLLRALASLFTRTLLGVLAQIVVAAWLDHYL